MSRSFAYLAKVAPIGKNIAEPGDDGPIVLDEKTFATWMERPWHVKVRRDHNVLDTIGQCSDIRVRDGWYQAEFITDPAFRTELEIGQPISVGINQMRRTGLLLLMEISIVDRGGIPGAQIISRREYKSSVAPEPRRTVAPARTEPAGEVIYGNGQLVRRNIGRVTAVNGVPVSDFTLPSVPGTCATTATAQSSGRADAYWVGGASFA